MNLIRIKKYEWECIKKIGREYNHLERGFFNGQNKESEVMEELLQEYRLLAYLDDEDLKELLNNSWIGGKLDFAIKLKEIIKKSNDIDDIF